MVVRRGGQGVDFVAKPIHGTGDALRGVTRDIFADGVADEFAARFPAAAGEPVRGAEVLVGDGNRDLHAFGNT
jgi:hypothetical protein